MSAHDQGISVDVLIVGGGAQGVWLLNEATRAGYSAFLVSNSNLGEGQTLHSHVYIHNGYLYRDLALAKRLRDGNEAWDRFLEARQLPRPVSRSLFGFLNPAAARLHEALWMEAGLPCLRSDMPEFLRQGILASGVCYSTDEIWLNGEALIRSLADAVTELVGKGNVVGFVRTRRAVNQVKVETQGGKTIVFKPKFVVLTAGRGNQDLLILVGAGDHASAGRLPVAQRLRASQMLVVRGSQLPELTGVFPDLDLFIVSRREGDETVWLVSYGFDEDVLGLGPNQDPPEDPQRSWRAWNMLRDLAPVAQGCQVRVYTGVKAEGAQTGGGALIPTEEVIVHFGLDNLLAVWPTKLTLVPQTTARVLSIIRCRLGHGSGAPASVPSIARPVLGCERWKSAVESLDPRLRS